VLVVRVPWIGRQTVLPTANRQDAAQGRCGLRPNVCGRRLTGDHKFWHRRDQRKRLREVYDADDLLICWANADSRSLLHA